MEAELTPEKKLDMSLDAIMTECTEDKGGRVRKQKQNRHSSRPYDMRQPDRLHSVLETSNRRHGEREHGNRRERDTQYIDTEEVVASDQFVKISATCHIKSMAGRIAHSARAGRPPTLLAIGHNCLNQAVKAVAIARKYVADSEAAESHGACFDITCQPAFREKMDDERDRDPKPSLALYLAKRQHSARKRGNQKKAELTVASHSEATTVAGALAARVRDRDDVSLTAIGVDAVAIAIRAICHARVFLEADGVDIKCLPRFVHIDKAAMQLSGLCFEIIVEDAA
ncbi:hypothetical protein WJX72_006984 [[Myrmecia] bisecta]|uniref:Uncharacterized protein n=1 Tax=[Myrmecia] bisecta TaxID=41462 RepID=A0AAW1P8Q9_9CHLO